MSGVRDINVNVSAEKAGGSTEEWATRLIGRGVIAALFLGVAWRNWTWLSEPVPPLSDAEAGGGSTEPDPDEGPSSWSGFAPWLSFTAVLRDIFLRVGPWMRGSTPVYPKEL